MSNMVNQQIDYSDQEHDWYYTATGGDRITYAPDTFLQHVTITIPAN